MSEMQKVKEEYDKSGVKWVTYLEVEALRTGAKASRNPIRNELIILMLYRHGLRESELCDLQLEAINLDEARIFIKRVKNGNDFIHPIASDELRLLRRYLRLRETKKGQGLPWLFVSEQGTSFCRDSINKMVTASYKRAGLRKITPHMLRHGCGYALINKGYDVRVVQDYLGHKDIRNTAIYTRLDDKQFKGLWD